MSENEKPDKTRFVRIWSALNIEEVKKHLLLIDDLYGTCGNCKQLGLNYLKDKTCPGCKTTFEFLATNMKNPADVGKILARIKTEGLSFSLIDREDFNRATASNAVKDLFKS